jgi:hypothetical protein
VADALREAFTESGPLVAQRNGQVLVLPPRGRLLFCTDLHGNLRDFRRMRELFEQAKAEYGHCQLLFCGDLVHGPCYAREEWPDYLGEFYIDESGALLDEFAELSREHPGQVHCLLGNHEHSHIGGPHTPKFWEDETAYFEHSVGEERAARYRDLFRSFPLMALSSCGAAFTHAAPNVQIKSVSEVIEARYEGHEQMNLMSIYTMPLLGRMLWSRRCPDVVVKRFLSVVSDDATLHHIVAFGHDIAVGGYERFGDEQLMLSTSFGLDDEEKTYLELDLGGCYASVNDLTPGRELKSLWPAADDE